MQRDPVKIDNRRKFVKRYIEREEKINPGINRQQILNELSDFLVFSNKRTLERIIYSK